MMKENQQEQSYLQKAKVGELPQEPVQGQGFGSQSGSSIKEGIAPSLKQGQQEDLTPGRAPAEGPDMELATPSHERWEQDTFDRDPTEGEELPPSSERPKKS